MGLNDLIGLALSAESAEATRVLVKVFCSRCAGGIVAGRGRAGGNGGSIIAPLAYSSSSVSLSRDLRKQGEPGRSAGAALGEAVTALTGSR